jgi:xanthine dehydrogenase accessory factor
VRRATLEALIEPRPRSEVLVLATDLDTGEQRLLHPLKSSEGPTDPLAEAATTAVHADRSQAIEVDGARTFLHVFNPPVQLAIVGAVHIAQQLAAMAKSAGYAVTVVDPRTAFATQARFPGVTLLRSWPSEGLAELGLDRRTAVVTVTHDPKLDDPALQAALASDAFYIGALGSRRTHRARLDRLREAGLSESQLMRIHAPVGLDIRARTPGEIAASVLAEIVQELRANGE